MTKQATCPDHGSPSAADRAEELWEQIGVLTDAIGYLMSRDHRLLGDAAGVLYDQLDKANTEYLALIERRAS